MNDKIEVNLRPSDEVNSDDLTLDEILELIDELYAEEEANSNSDALREETAASGKMPVCHLPLGPFFRG